MLKHLFELLQLLTLGATYNNSAGTLTNSGTQAAIAIDDVALSATRQSSCKESVNTSSKWFL